MATLPEFTPDPRRPQRGGVLSKHLGICCGSLPSDAVGFLMSALDTKRNYIRPLCRREAIRIVRDVLKLDPMSGADLRKVWPSLKGPISTRLVDYDYPGDLSRFVPDPEKPARVSGKSTIETDTVLDAFPGGKATDEPERSRNDRQRTIICEALDLKKRIIRPTYRRGAIRVMRLMGLDPMSGVDIHKVWPVLKPGPISTDPADYED